MRTTALACLGKDRQQIRACKLMLAPAALRLMQVQRAGYVLWRALVIDVTKNIKTVIVNLTATTLREKESTKINLPMEVLMMPVQVAQSPLQ